MEIIHLVEQSNLSIKKTLSELGIPSSTFYRWYHRYQKDGYDGLLDKQPRPKQFWNRIPQSVRNEIVDLALTYPDKSPKQIAWLFVDEKGYFVSESSVYRILKGFDLVKSPVFQMVSGKDKFDDEGIVTEGFPALVDHWERLRIRKRTMQGRYDKADAGKPVLNGIPPYGYRKKGKGKEAELIKYDPELNVVRDIFDWYTIGNGTGLPMSMREIARKLNEDNVPSTTPNKKWTNIAIHRILSHEIYAGTTYYGKTKTRMKGNKKITIKLPKEQWRKIPVPHLAIIEAETYEIVEARKERNRQLAKRNRKRNYLMSGHFRCGTCGQVMVGHQRQGYLRYQCSSMWPKTSEEPCLTANRSIITHEVDNLVWDWLCQLLTDESALEEGLNKMIEDNKDKTGTKRRRLETLKSSIGKRERSIQRLMDELNEGEYEDDYTRNVFRQKIKENTNMIKEFERELNQLKDELFQVELTDDFRQEVEAMAAQIRDNLSDASFAGKRVILDKLDLKVVFHYDKGIRWLEASCGLTIDPIALHPSKI